ncbi:helix-turn-helix domain-containing protein [Deinococcus peraridilitoris]|uniref:Putative transcription regulator containing HTH domain protein n=1 Tax=Deinococcus peraridilitoris (strain DSM 19664 / LMG 22246 / CIP 109416 / KR-200) TaxID=937777 RepID=K9ZXV7_DEIPD|nr:helix-turn-helix domain-containing protein [Deinococcus peraridilitoris]AFZ65747.1 putative transcription regulator containing HTH domain protein [Deinococcus peraridilitoris DSM 19664]
MTQVADLSRLTAAWQDVDALAHDLITPIQNDEQHDRALQALDTLLSYVGENDEHPLANFVRLAIDNVQSYEERAHPMRDAQPHETLAFLMDKNGVKQKDVEAATGIPQGNLSKLLRGQRNFTAEHARKLGAYFQVNPGVFL